MIYKVLNGQKEELEVAVNNHLKTGFKLQGGICSTGRVFYQAVVKPSVPARKGGK